MPPPLNTTKIVHTTGQRLDTMLSGIQTDTVVLDAAIAELTPHVGGLPWTATGDGSATQFDLTAAASATPADYLVTVSGVDQYGAFTLASITGGVRLTFPEAPPTGVPVVVRQITQHARTA
jgi:hypothetical protein